MAEVMLGGRSTEITLEGKELKIVFHPIAKGAKHPKASVFQIKISKSDLETLKKAF